MKSISKLFLVGPLLGLIAVGAIGLCFVFWSGSIPLAKNGHDEHAYPDHSQGEGHAEPGEDAAKGPHNGRLLSDGDLKVEITIFERGVPPEFRVYAFENGKPIAPDDLKMLVKLTRLGGLVEEFSFAKEADYLMSDKTVYEPHSFDVEIVALHKEHSHTWKYSAYESRITLTPKQIQEAGIEILSASPAKISSILRLPGEITLNGDTLGHIVPRVGGVVREVFCKLGNHVKTGDKLAILESRELADAKAADLAASARLELGRLNLQRVQTLFDKKIAPEEELLKARQTLAESEIEHTTAEAKLHALGQTEAEVQASHTDKDVNYARYELRAPFEGTIIERHISLGELVTPESDVFVLADLSTAWVDLTVYQRDVPSVRIGQKVVIKPGAEIPSAETHISYVSSVVSEETRAAFARAVLPNPDGRWRPGTFITGEIIIEATDAHVVIPSDALVTLNGETAVFIHDQSIFEPRFVVTGKSDAASVEIAEGLRPGDQYVARGAFILKAELGKSEAKHEH
ncbi:MAG: efflux RND transporter periplasmic adaptor subunit [Planctomycetes bacterium]|nr:efflux RND transporter periplasmic adaptor subunit [Planctomycetota bacterium]